MSEPLRDGDGDMISSGEHRKIVMPGDTLAVCDTCVNPFGLNVRWDQSHPDDRSTQVDREIDDRILAAEAQPLDDEERDRIRALRSEARTAIRDDVMDEHSPDL